MCHAIAYALTLDDGLLKSSRGACSFFACHSVLNEESGRRTFNSALQEKWAALL